MFGLDEATGRFSSGLAAVFRLNSLLGLEAPRDFSALNLRHVLALLILGCGNIVFAVEESPRDVVERYYMTDLTGVRLSGQTYKAIKPLTIWEHEPGWDYAFITDDVKIYKTQKLSNTEVLVEVRYHIVGILSGDNLSETVERLKYIVNS